MNDMAGSETAPALEPSDMPVGGGAARNIVLIVHYFAPISVAGAKRPEGLAKYFAREGRNVTVITTRKTPADGPFTEDFPPGVTVLELDRRGRKARSKRGDAHEDAASGRRRLKDMVTRWFGQLPDPRLPFALSFRGPNLAAKARAALGAADVVIASCPPWPMLLAARFAGRRFGVPVVLDYRDQFSACHEMPGGAMAKALELRLDAALAKAADGLVTVTHPMADYYRRFQPNTRVILNGYDPEKIAAARNAAPWRPRPPGQPLTIRYLGLVTPGRVPRRLLAALLRRQQAGALEPGSLNFEYYGEWRLVKEEIGSRYPSLAPLFHFFGPVGYAKALELVVSADHLLFCENAVAPRKGEEASAAGILTSKLFEYLASGRPILADLSDESLAASFLHSAGGHFVSDRPKEFEAFLASDAFWSPARVEIGDFVRSLSREGQARDYLAFLDDVAARATAKHDR